MIDFSTINTNSKYTVEICFRNLSVFQPLLAVLFDEKERRSLFVLIHKLLFVSRRFKVLFKSTAGHVIVFVTNPFSSRVF